MQNQSRALAKQNVSQKNLEAHKPWTPDDKASLALIIGQVFDLQKQYGKSAAQLETIVNGFCWAMKGYPVQMVIDGFAKYILMKSDLPTPADIRAIIDPIKPAWKPDKGYYQTLKKIYDEQGPYGLDQDEIEYMQAYQEHMKSEYKANRE